MSINEPMCEICPGIFLDSSSHPRLASYYVPDLPPSQIVAFSLYFFSQTADILCTSSHCNLVVHIINWLRSERCFSNFSVLYLSQIFLDTLFPNDSNPTSLYFSTIPLSVTPKGVCGLSGPGDRSSRITESRSHKANLT